MVGFSLLSGCRTTPSASHTASELARGIDWAQSEADAIALLQRLVRVDTSNPPGQEDKAVKILQRALTREGIAVELYQFAPGRVSLFARLAGTEAEAKPLVLLSHLDTPGAEPRAWPHEAGPLSGTIRDDAIYGRGTLGGKGLAVIHAMTLINLSRAAARPRRDIILVATADGAGLGRGIEELIIKKPILLSAEMVLGVGGMSVRDLLGDGRLIHAVANSEKGFANIIITAREDPPASGGHEAAPDRLNRALVKIRGRKVRPRLTPSVEETLAAIAEHSDPPKSWVLDSGVLASIFELETLGKGTITRHMVTDTINLTEVRAQGPISISPARAYAYLRCELLSDSDPARLRQELRIAVDDPRVHFNVTHGELSSRSEPIAELLDVIAREAAVEGDVEQLAAPFMSPWPSDLRFLRRQGVPAFGYAPFVVSTKDFLSIRGRSEHLSLLNLSRGLRQMLEIARTLAASPPSD